MRVNTESYLWRRKFSHFSCQDLNLQPFNHESSTLATSYPVNDIHICLCRTEWVNMFCTSHLRCSQLWRLYQGETNSQITGKRLMHCLWHVSLQHFCAQKDGSGEAVMVCDMPDSCKFPSLDNRQKRFLWTHKEAAVLKPSYCVNDDLTDVCLWILVNSKQSAVEGIEEYFGTILLIQLRKSVLFHNHLHRTKGNSNNAQLMSHVWWGTQQQAPDLSMITET